MPESNASPMPSSVAGRVEAQARFFRIVEATTDIVAMTDRAGRLLYMNAAGRAVFGIADEQQVNGLRVASLYPAWAYEILLHEALPATLHHGSWSGEGALLCPDGREMPVLQVVLAHTDDAGEIEFFSAICRDISERKQKELERIEWANRYDAAIRASGQVLFDWDSTTGAITYGGDVRRLLGYGEEEMEGGLARLREIVHPHDLAAFDVEIERLLTARDPLHLEFRITRKEGGAILIEAQGFFFLDRLGRIGRMVGFLKDVTSERHADEAIHSANERLERRVIERTATLERLATELKNNVRQQEAVARLGQRALAGMPLDALMQEAVEIARAALRADCTAALEYDPSCDGFIVRAESGWPVHGVPLHIPGGSDSQSGYSLQAGVPLTSADFSRETRFRISSVVMEAGLRSGVTVCIQAGETPLGVLNAFSRATRDYAQDDINFLQSLANIITAAIERGRTEDDLRRARAEAEAANRAKSEFLSRMSHELRTPLNAILGFAQILEMEEHNERQAESIAHITRGGQNLLNLINEVLEIARLDAGRAQFHVENVELPEFLRALVGLSAMSAVRQQIAIHVAEMPDAVISTDRERLKQVFLNLLSNAVKFNKPGGSVTLTVTAAPGPRWRVAIADTGSGIPEEQLARLFVPFERLGVRDRGVEGRIGLALCQRLVDALGGALGVESRVGEGSTFWVELPAAVVTMPEAPAAPVVEKTHTVLYIEDDIANFHLLDRILESRREVRLLSALQGSLGLDLAREHLPDLILLDLNLPDMSGEQLLRALKADAVTAGIPVIAVTGEVAGDHPEVLRALGALALLEKPYRVQELLALLDRTLAGDGRGRHHTALTIK